MRLQRTISVPFVDNWNIFSQRSDFHHSAALALDEAPHLNTVRIISCRSKTMYFRMSFSSVVSALVMCLAGLAFNAPSAMAQSCASRALSNHSVSYQNNQLRFYFCCGTSIWPLHAQNYSVYIQNLTYNVDGCLDYFVLSLPTYL